MQGFGFGLYDGITGLVTDPYKGAKKEGAAGFVKGVGQGIFSVPFRVAAGAWAVPGYAMKGLYQEMIKSKGKTVQNYIIAARIAQGYDEANSLSKRERDDIVSRWKYVKVGIKKKKNVGADQMDSLHTLVLDKRKKRQERWARVNHQFKRPEAQASFPPAMSEHSGYQEPPLTQSTSYQSNVTNSGPRTLPEGQQPAWRQRPVATFPRTTSAQTTQSQQNALEAELIAEEEAERRELEAAIAASISHNSHGDEIEDKLVANAIRTSIAELDRTPENAGAAEEEQALQRALTASLEEASRQGRTEQEQKQLEDTIRQSLLDTSLRRQHGDDSEWDSSDTEDDQEFQRIVAESKELAHMHEQQLEKYQTASGAQESGIMGAIADATGANGPTHPADDDEELNKALALSEKVHQESMEKLEKQKTEEDIVMEYVRKQSLLEEEHRQRVRQGRETGGEGSGGAK